MTLPSALPLMGVPQVWTRLNEPSPKRQLAHRGPWNTQSEPLVDHRRKCSLPQTPWSASSPLRCTLTGPEYSREKIHRRWDTCTSPLGPPVEVQVPLPSLDAPSKRTLDERHRACFQWDGFLVYNDGMTILVSQPGPHRRHRMEPDPMKVAIAETWRRVDGTLGSLEPMLPLRPCSSGMCTEFAVIATAREANAGPAVTPLDGALCSQCANWESERASLSLSWVGRTPGYTSRTLGRGCASASTLIFSLSGCPCRMQQRYDDDWTWPFRTSLVLLAD